MSKSILIGKTIVRPIISEKGVGQGSDQKYHFEVAPGASKTQIKEAVESLFKVSVTAVNTLNYRGKPKRLGQSFGKRNDWRKAVITLKEGDSIDLYGGGAN